MHDLLCNNTSNLPRVEYLSHRNALLHCVGEAVAHFRSGNRDCGMEVCIRGRNGRQHRRDDRAAMAEAEGINCWNEGLSTAVFGTRPSRPGRKGSPPASGLLVKPAEKDSKIIDLHIRQFLYIKCYSFLTFFTQPPSVPLPLANATEDTTQPKPIAMPLTCRLEKTSCGPLWASCAVQRRTH